MTDKREIEELRRDLERSRAEDIRNNRRQHEDDSTYPESERTKELERQLHDAKRELDA